MTSLTETAEITITAAGDPFTAARNDDCPHCWGSGWVMMTAENDFGEMEDYFVLCRRCGKQTSRGLQQSV
jgi:hypothetical protein